MEGKTVYSIINQSVGHLAHVDYREMAEDQINKVLRLRESGEIIEQRNHKAEGNAVEAEAGSVPCVNNGQVRVLAAYRDISGCKHTEELKKSIKEEKQRLAEAIEYDQIKTEFFSNISHELRTPLNIILGALQLFDYYFKDLSIEDNQEKVKRHAKTMKQNCYRLLRLVNNLIDITKIDSGFFNVQLKNYNIVSIIEEITLSVSEYIENKGINLQFDTDIEEKFMACDADKIERIMLNLLSNSIKYTKPGGNIKVNVEDKGDKICISVEDDGIGIPTDKKDVIFERFRQVDKSFVRSQEGSGIGLSLVKSLVEIHDGKISVESELDKGSTFIIELPAKYLEKAYDNCDNNIYQSQVERIHIEFSDIYF